MDSGSHSAGSWTSVNSSTHKKYCTTCSREMNSGSHGSWTSTGSTNHKCGSCSYTEAHSGWTYGSWESDGDDQHYRDKNCGKCSYSTTEYADHTWGSWGSWSELNATYHVRYRQCTAGCGVSDSELGTHSYGAWGSWSYVDYYHERSRSCGSCGKTQYEEAACNTNGSVSYDSNGDGTHQVYVKCSVCGGSSDSYEEDCSYSDYSSSYHKCGDCGDTDSHDSSDSTDWYDNGSNHRKDYYCSVCGRYRTYSTGSHDWDWGGWYDNGSNHRRDAECSVCGATDYETSSHDWEDYSDESVCGSICSTCGRESLDSHNFDSCEYSSNGDGTHDVIEQCAYCGDTFNTGTEDCSWATGSYDYCFEAYDYCRECGDTIDYGSDCTFGGNYSSNDDGTHTDSCEICGYDEVSSCSYGGAESHGSDEHGYTCSDCGYWDGPYSCDFGWDGYCECGNYDSSTGGGGWWSHYVIRLKKNFGFLRNLFASVIWNKNWF